jgi:uncharacterized damage-inducible protein DinB
MTPNDLLASGVRMSTALIHRMVDDLTPEEFHHQPAPGANCAAWIVGHLATTINRVLHRLNATDVPDIPEEIKAKFQMTQKPAGQQKDLGASKSLLALLDGQAKRYEAVLRNLSDEALSGEPELKPPEAKTRGDLLLFLSLHSAFHAGQLSTIRRSLGKPPLA